MPTTINGIGTHYYGNKNRVVRTGVCRACGGSGSLSSYDTRLWFVVVFVPVIPLGRKRIIDECSHCRRHFVANQDEYAMSRQLALSGSRDRHRTEGTTESAIAAHAEMLGFHAFDDARQFRDEVLAASPDDALLHAAFGRQLDGIGDYDLATPLFEQAYGLNPELPEVRDGMALRHIVEGNLDEARRLLDFLEEPGAGQLYPLGRLEQLAQAYQKRGRHAETLELCEHLVREAPEVGQHHAFRKFVRTSEKAQREGKKVLPRSEQSWRALFDPNNGRFSKGQRWAAFLALVAVLAVGGLFGLSEYRRRHRTVHVYNDFGAGAQVVIDGNLNVPPDRRSHVVLAEGLHHVKVTGVVNEEFDLEVRSPLWERWTYSPAWVVNVGGASPLYFETLHYAENPREPETRLAVGENAFSAPHVDYLFEPAPDTIRVEGKSAEITKQRLSLAPEAPEALFRYTLAVGSREAALRYAESRLLIDPHDATLLTAYAQAVMENNEQERAKTALKPLREQRPILVNVHRYYQELHPTTAEREALINEYDQLLAKDPNDAALLYLRGRLTPSRATADDFYQRSIAADPQISWPWSAIGYQAMSVGDWAKCKNAVAEAQQRNHPESLDFPSFVAGLGLGESAELIRRYRERIPAEEPINALATTMMLATSLIVENNAEGARRALSDWESKLPAGETPVELLNGLRGTIEYDSGDYAALERRIAAGEATGNLKFLWLLATGKPQQAAADGELAELLTDPWNALALSVAFELGGEADEARSWRERACESLSKRGFEEVLAAKLLCSDVPPTPEQLGDVTLEPAQRALVITGLALRFADQRSDLLALAKRLSVQPGGFSPLIQQAVNRSP